MAWYDYIPSVAAGKWLYHKVDAHTPQQPGVGGPAAYGAQLVQDPITGVYYDPQTGTSYSDPHGNTPITDPNVAQQVAANYAKSQSFLNQAQGLQQQQQTVFGGQNDLASQLRGVIAGKTPSLAEQQLGVGQQQIANQQLAQAAGTSGPGQLLAQLAAMRNTGQAQIGMNNAAGMTRTQEESDAREALARLLNSQVSGLGGAINTSLGAGTDYSHLAASGQGAQQGLNANANTDNAQANRTLGYTAIKGIGSMLS